MNAIIFFFINREQKTIGPYKIITIEPYQLSIKNYV